MTDIDTAAPSEVLKRDARGRVHTTRTRREALLDEFERSGLSGPAFARVAGLCYQTFATWRHQRKRQRAGTSSAGLPAIASSANEVHFLEAVMEQRQNMPCRPAHVPVLCLTLPGGASMQITDAAQAPLAAQLLKALATPC